MHYIIGNWKMAPATWVKAKKLTRDLLEQLPAGDDAVRVIVCPPLLYQRLVGEAIAPAGNIVLGAQDVHFEAVEASTGEISAAQLRDSGVTYVIVGHSERRALGEDNAVVAKKAQAVIAEGMSVVLCVGESSRDEHWQDFLVEEVASVLSLLAAEDLERLVIAYEPIWAVGSAEADTPEGAQTSARLIRNVVRERFGEEASEKIAVLYGGSVTEKNIESFAEASELNGVLVGRASRDAGQFSLIIQAFL